VCLGAWPSGIQLSPIASCGIRIRNLSSGLSCFSCAPVAPCEIAVQPLHAPPRSPALEQRALFISYLFASAVSSNLIFYPNLWPRCLRLRLYSLVHLPNSCNSLRTRTFRFFKSSFSTAHPIPFDFEHLFYLPIPLDSFPGQRSDYYFLIA